VQAAKGKERQPVGLKLLKFAASRTDNKLCHEGEQVADRRLHRQAAFILTLLRKTLTLVREDADEVCREISVEIELLGFQPLIRFA
jgi:hypothetical protein